MAQFYATFMCLLDVNLREKLLNARVRPFLRACVRQPERADYIVIRGRARHLLAAGPPLLSAPDLRHPSSFLSMARLVESMLSDRDPKFPLAFKCWM